MADAPTMEVRARLTADTAQFTKGLDNAARASEAFSGQASKLSSTLTALGVAAGAVGAATIAFGVKSFMAAARVQELDVAMQAVGWSTGKTYEALQQTALAIKNQGIEMEIAQKATLKFAQNNLDMAKAGEVARVAQDLAVIGAMNSTDAFDMLTHAIITGRSEVLKSVGIQKSAGQAYQEYAQTIGKTAKSLSYTEKQAAVLNMVLKEGGRVAGTYEAAMQTPGKVLRSFPRLFNNIQVAMGDVLLKGFGPMIYSLYELTKRVIKAVEGNGAFKAILTSLTKVVVRLTEPVTKFIDGLGEWVDKFDALKPNIDKVAQSIAFLTPAVLALGAAFAVTAGKQIFGAVPILGGFLGALKPIPVALAIFAATNLEVRQALGKMLSALSPLLGVLKTLASVILNVLGYAVGTLARGFSKLADGVKAVTGFFQSHKAAAQGLAIVFGILAAAIGATVIFLLAQQAIMALTTGITSAMVTATAALGLAEVSATFATAGLTAGMSALAAALWATGIPQVVIALSALVVAFVIAWKTSEGFRNVVTTVFNTVATVVGKVIAFVLKLMGWTLIGFGKLISVHGIFGKIVAAVFQFVWETYLTVWIGVVKLIKWVIDGFIMLMENQGILGQVIEAVLNFIIKGFLKTIRFVLGVIKNWLDGFVSLMEGHATLRKIVETVFNVIIRIIANMVTQIIVGFANLIKGIATIIHYFEILLEVAKDIVKGVIAAFFNLGKGVLGIFSKVATNLGTFLENTLSTVKEWARLLLTPLLRLPIVGPMIQAAFNALDALGGFAAKGLSKLGNSILNVFAGTEDGTSKSVDAITGVSKALINSSKSWGNYSSGVSGALSNIANKMLDFNAKIVEFAAKDNGAVIVDNLIAGAKKGSELLGTMISKIADAEEINFGKAVVDTLVAGAKLASEALGNIIDKMEEMKKVKVGEFIVDTASEAAIKAGEFLLGLAANIEEFTSGNVLGKLTGAIGDFFSSMKTEIGFGDIIAEAQKTFQTAFGSGADNTVANEIQSQADRMKAIRDAMQQGIDSIKQVLQDLQQAAKDFADSLKDTIVGFAGLKGVELPDGFIPQAKSLIENMRMRLDKSQQFATQIAQLQAYGLDAGALKDLIEQGPIKGAQLAASILGGNARENIAQINALQRAITFTGAAIGQYGSEAAYSGLIANAQAKYADLTAAQLAVMSSGKNVAIQQGAFVVNVNIAKATTPEEEIDMITRAIQDQFQILAKELASK